MVLVLILIYFNELLSVLAFVVEIGFAADLIDAEE